ncbi:MAG: nucleotidyltransferase family protein [Deltaproteobacteria bacterium]|nr:nucleotidyltransferase family protein [Deltaproteobacteria bacterium]
MSLYPSLLFSIAAKERFSFDKSCVDELYGLTENITHHPFKNLVGVIYYNLRANGYLNRLPMDLRKSLDERYYASLAFDLCQRSWLEDFIKRLLPKDVVIVLIKGSANWGTIYPPSAPRLSSDIDILVRDSDFERIISIMNTLGERLIVDKNRLFTNHVAYEYSYRINKTPIAVEVHRRLSYPFVGKVDYQRLFGRSKTYPIYKDKRVRILSPQDRIINIFIHSLKHAHINVHEVVDAYRIIKKYSLDINDILNEAVKYGVSDYARIFLIKVISLVEGGMANVLGDDRRNNDVITLVKSKIFEFLHCKDAKVGLRVRQIMSMFLMDDFADVLRFGGFYSDLRFKDWIYNLLYVATGKNYAEEEK